MVSRPVVLALALAVSAAASTARADMIVFFTDRASFEAAAGTALNRESFEGEFGPAASINFGDFTLSEEGGEPNVVNRIDQTFANFLGVGNAITDGEFAAAYGGDGGSKGVFQFTSLITAFGVDITVAEPADFGNDNSPPGFNDEHWPNGSSAESNAILKVTLDVVMNGESKSFVQDVDANEPFFLGVIDRNTPFDRVSVSVSEDRVVAFDDVAFGTAADPVAVPEPTVLATLSLGLLAAAGAMAIQRRRRVHC